jgi:hypothetical protein
MPGHEVIEYTYGRSVTVRRADGYARHNLIRQTVEELRETHRDRPVEFDHGNGRRDKNPVVTLPRFAANPASVPFHGTTGGRPRMEFPAQNDDRTYQLRGERTATLDQGRHMLVAALNLTRGVLERDPLMDQLVDIDCELARRLEMKA